MASPADFVFNRAPTVGDLPQANFDWLGNLSQAYYQGQQNALNSRFARLGVNAYQQDAGGQQPQQSGGAPYSGDATSYNQATWNTESSNNPNVRDSSKGAVGVGQVMPGTWARFAQPGEDIRNPDDNRRVSKRIQDHYLDKYRGDAARAAVAYFSGEGNVSEPGSPTPWKVNKSDGSIRTSEYVRRILAGMGNQRVAGVSQPGTGSPAPVEQPKGAVGYHPNMSVQSDNGAGPGNLKLASSGSPDEFVGQPNRATSTGEVAANTQGDSGSSGSIGPAPNVQPGNRDVTPQGPGPVTQPGSVPGEPENDPQVRRLDAQMQQKAAEQERNSRLSGLPYNEFRTKRAEDLRQQMTILQQQRGELISRLGKEREMRIQTGEEATRGQNTADIKYYDEQYAGTQKRGEEAENNVQTLKLAKSLMDDPNFDSGPGSQFSLKLKQIAAKLPGFDSSLATPQEAYKKVVSEAILEQLRSLGGQGLGQVRQSEIGVIKDSAQSLDVSKATNQLRTELAMRIATRWTQPIAEMAREYKARYGKLDAGWDRVRAMYMERTPLLSTDELKDTRRISPPLVRTPDDLKRIGWKDGDPFRTPEGRIFTHKPVDVNVKTMKAGFQ